MAELAQVLREARTARGLGLREAARSLGLTHPQLADFERGTTHKGRYKAIPNRETLKKMAELYGFPSSTLLALAGLLEVEPAEPPKPSEVEVRAQEVAEILRQLPEDHQGIFLQLARVYRNEVLKGVREKM